MENSRIELRGIVLPVQMGGLLGGGGGAKGMLAPPLKLLGGAWPPLAPPLPTPMFFYKCRSICSVRRFLWEYSGKFIRPATEIQT